MTPFKIKDKEYRIHLTYRQCLQEIPKKFDIHICKMFTDSEKSSDTLERLMMDDELTINLLWHLIQDEAVITYDEFLDSLSGAELDKFREAFWDEVANFFGPLRQGMIRQIWKEFKKEIKKADLQKMTSEKSYTESSQEE
ncbi:MAG: hypothetical protein KatS3mg087_1367 [Patescibacteria group bacterium]|nr:MAG: hypothetical protein KatS3mg087_1367 [Patescibacteria group bacterium]